MSELTYEELVDEESFVALLQTHSELFFRLANLLRARSRAGEPWIKKHYYQLVNETDTLESALDDYGARYNRTYAFFTELVASTRWFAHSGYSLAHLQSRLESYAANGGGDTWKEAAKDVERGLRFVERSALLLLEATCAEAGQLGIQPVVTSFPELGLPPVVAKRRLPRNVGQAELTQEEQKIAEVVTKFLQARAMLHETGVRHIDDADERHEVFARVCSEEQARVYEATVHNLQSTYDTHIQNTVLEAQDPRLARLRGHISPALHLLQAVTFLAHFIERHEIDIRSEEAKRRIASMVDRSEVEAYVWNLFLYWAHRFLDEGASIADELLPEYTRLLELEIDLPADLSLHARPAALVVGIVNHYGTPVEMEVGGRRCNAGSILELLVTVGSLPDETRFTFRGDERPVRDIGLLFEAGLGESGLEHLPSSLGYLRQS